ncbi:hypothetical protein BC939DRAFT_531385 [Gamsiella multidivaricata]|uniref:uncharacterized protein n=1 Tax=Gamsiella multidivaricata TaxID=101098 RepID=UPI00221F9440|nr:uncharacterized protein BC939DRAFT_531385 [Gamsiella multidivaricata]KAG0365232.1 hypothetical protein BGZ54_006741 [Gamsiella multidivaricata]KAI7819352.1 hypothetical protein BC939DRAFT_531385 [Gamsiella multidivaricata]
MPTTLYTFGLAFHFFSTIASAVPVADASDPCSTLAALNGTRISYKDVANCYRNIPYDSTISSSTLSVLDTLFRDFYIFRDAALTPRLPEPFTSPPVDIMKELGMIRMTRYQTDFDLHSAIMTAIWKLNDPHAVYSPDCYSAYSFSQSLRLYAPVAKGQQSLRVFRDERGRGLEDCSAITINGLPGLKYMQRWADKYAPYSKDSGVRMNFALASQTFDPRTQSFTLSSGVFSERYNLPEQEFVEYELQCPDNNNRSTGDRGTRTVRLQEEWLIQPQIISAFRDTTSYVHAVCLRFPSVKPRRSIKSQRGERSLPPAMEHKVPFPKRSISSHNTPSEVLRDAEFIISGNGTSFYRLKSLPHVGIMVVFTHETTNSEMSVIKLGLDTLHRLNVTHIILDLQGNMGGFVDFASLLTELFFPRKMRKAKSSAHEPDPLEKSFVSDTRVSSMVQRASGLLTGAKVPSFFNPYFYFDFKTERSYTYNLFHHPVPQIRNGRSALYSPLLTLNPTNISRVADTHSYAWTNDPSKILILSDGRCGSACALTCHLMRAKYNVTGIAVGGHQGEALSMFSFAGGALTTLDQIHNTFESVNVASPIKQLPYRGRATVPILEVYRYGRSKGWVEGLPEEMGRRVDRGVPLEYDAESAKADEHLDLGVDTARRRDALWDQVARTAWATDS